MRTRYTAPSSKVSVSDTESRRWQFSRTLSAGRGHRPGRRAVHGVAGGANLRAMFGFPRSERLAGVRADEIFVYFDDFERVAK